MAVKLVARTDLGHEFTWVDGALYWVSDDGVGVDTLPSSVYFTVGSPVKLYYGTDPDPEDIYALPGIITDIITEGV